MDDSLGPTVDFKKCLSFFRDEITETENSFMEPKYPCISFRWFYTPNAHHLTSGEPGSTPRNVPPCQK